MAARRGPVGRGEREERTAGAWNVSLNLKALHVKTMNFAYAKMVAEQPQKEAVFCV